jgi:hypothetical protein
MNNVISGSAQAPRALVRVALVTTDLVALPLLGFCFAVVLALALASLGIAAGGVNFLLGLRFLDYFPIFPVVPRILSGFSLLAFAAFMLVATLPLWRLFRATWQRYWSWHGSAWAGIFTARGAVGGATGVGDKPRRFVRLIGLLGIVFLCLFAVSVSLMFLLAAGPFWHVWGWFT